MMVAAVILLSVAGRLPWPALAVIAVRDSILLGGARFAMPRGYEFSVSFLGKLATWVLYVAVAFVIVTHKGTDWPLWIFWIGVGLAVAAAVVYTVSAWRTIRRPQREVAA